MLLLVVVILLLFGSVVHAIEIFVASDGGNDEAHNGTLAFPFGSIEKAQLYVRHLHQTTNLTEFHIVLRQGRYEMAQTLDFGVEDANVTYQAYCNPLPQANETQVLAFPYHDQRNQSFRSLWNGVGNPAEWNGPVDPFVAMGINQSANVLLNSPISSSSSTSTGFKQNEAVCVDKVGIGHTCYEGAMATCVNGCMVACASHIERKIYSQVLYHEFSHLFGRDLENEAECVEICAESCRSCERVVISGAKRIERGELDWKLWSVVNSNHVFVTNLSDWLPLHLTADQSDITGATPITTLYLNDTQLPRAGFPDCHVMNCSYAPVKAARGMELSYDRLQFSSKTTTWTNAQDAIIKIRPNASKEAVVTYSLASIDAQTATIRLGAGGTQLSRAIFENGPFLHAQNPQFRVENVLQELDAPGEWYFDPVKRLLYLIPPTSDAESDGLTALEAATLEIPVLRQLIRVSGSRANRFVQAAHASQALQETESKALATDIRFRHLVFSGTQLHHTDVYEDMGTFSHDASWPLPRIAAVFMETVARIEIAHCTFEKVGGNAIMVSGVAQDIQIVHNNVSFVGGAGILLLARSVAERNAFQTSVRPSLLYPQRTNVSFNAIHHFGRQWPHAAGIMAIGTQQTWMQRNLLYAFPSSGAAYVIQNAVGASASSPQLLRHMKPIEIPTTLAPNLLTAYTTIVQPENFDLPLIAKLIGAPECPSGSGRVDTLYGDPEPFAYMENCSGCCFLHDASARIRLHQPQAVPWSQTTRSVGLLPRQSLEVMAMASSRFQSVVDIYLSFHVVTPNQLIDLNIVAKWRIQTRRCRVQTQVYRTTTCGGPCGNCGISNAEMAERLRMSACKDGDEADVYSHVCEGPFTQSANCHSAGLRPHVYYNCSIQCQAITCS